MIDNPDFEPLRLVLEMLWGQLTDFASNWEYGVCHGIAESSITESIRKTARIAEMRRIADWVRSMLDDLPKTYIEAIKYDNE